MSAFKDKGGIAEQTILYWVADLQRRYAEHENLMSELRDMKPIGNAFDDAPIFNLADKIIRDRLSRFEDKVEALKKMDEATGEPGEYTQAAIDEYLAIVGK